MTQQPLVAVIDDDEGVRMSLDGLIRSLGYRVAMFDSAEAYLTSPASGKSQCVISDIQMPGMGGLALAEHLSRDEPSAPIILISAFIDEKVTTRAAAAGACACLRKPFDGEVLIEHLEAALAA